MDAGELELVDPVFKSLPRGCVVRILECAVELQIGKARIVYCEEDIRRTGWLLDNDSRAKEVSRAVVRVGDILSLLFPTRSTARRGHATEL
jgi:hypothetical protein